MFKGAGPVFQILSRVLKVFEPRWDRFGWHVAFVVTPTTLCESIGQGVVVSVLSKYTPEETRCYRWFDEQPKNGDIVRFVGSHLGEPYDIAIYFWTSIAYLVRHWWGRRVPLLFNNSWSCWELLFYFADRMGKPISESYDFPLITTLLRSMDEC